MLVDTEVDRAAVDTEVGEADSKHIIDQSSRRH